MLRLGKRQIFGVGRYVLDSDFHFSHVALWTGQVERELLHFARNVQIHRLARSRFSCRLEATIRQASAIAKVPVIVTKNGIGTDKDDRRIEYVRRALNGVARCIRDGIDVRGYCYWSLLDNFECNSL